MRYTVWSHPVETTYSTNIVSKATVFSVVCSLLMVVPPLLISYRTQGFWLKTATYREQPNIHFTHTLIVLLELEDGQNLVWSSREVDIEQEGNRVRVPLIRSREEDSNRDGVLDSLWLRAEFPLEPAEKVEAAHALLLFDYQLSRFSLFEMTGLIYVAGSGLSGRALDISGDIRLVQKEPLSHRGRDSRFSRSPLPADRPLDLTNVLRDYASRNISTRLDNSYSVWSRGAGLTGFNLNLNLNYPTQTVEYTPGLWQTLKWGWVQYLAVLVVFVYLFHAIKTFVFSHQVLPTIKQLPTK